MWIRKGFWLKGPIGNLLSGYSPSGRYWRHRQSWGAYGKTDQFGHGGEFLLPFEGDAGYPNLGINEIWKTLDIIDAPTPGGPDVIPLPENPPVQRKLQIAAGVQFWDAATGLVPVVKLGAASKVSSTGAASSTQFYVRVSTGGVAQQLRVNKVDATVIASSQLT